MQKRFLGFLEYGSNSVTLSLYNVGWSKTARPCDIGQTDFISE